MAATTTHIAPSTPPSASEPLVHGIFEHQTSTWQYIVADGCTSAALVIDPVLDINPATLQLSTQSADTLLAIIKKHGYRVQMILETHAHADHITAAAYLQNKLAQEQDQRPDIGIGQRIVQVQRLFGERYAIPANEYDNVFDRLFKDNERFLLGTIPCEVLHLPGHTPDHVGYHIGHNVFAGDSIFHMDVGSARADFPGGSASDLYTSKTKLLSLPEHTKLWVGHDYPPSSRDEGIRPSATVSEHRTSNKHFQDGVSEEAFVELRSARDSTLGEPKLLHHALQMNIRGGRLPLPNAYGQRTLQLPLKVGNVQALIDNGGNSVL